MTVAEPSLADTAAGRPVAADQEALVRYLAQRTRDRLSGDAAELADIQERPSQVLQLGVLPPLPPPDPDRGLTSEQVAQERRLPPSHIGAVFHLDPEPDATQATLEVQAAFLFYVQVYPDRETQAAYQGVDLGGRQAGQAPQANGRAARSAIAERYKRHRIESGPIPVTLDLTAPGRVTVPLDTAIRAVLGPVLADSKTVYPFSAAGQRLPDQAVTGSDEDYWEAIRQAEHPTARAQRPHELPVGAIEVDWRRQADGRVRVQAVLANKTVEIREKRKQGQVPTIRRELHFFNSRLEVRPLDEPIVPTRFRDTPQDFRYDHLRDVDATGINCVARRGDHADGQLWPVVTDTFPMYVQRRIEQNDDESVRMMFDELRGSEALAALGRIQNAMADFEAAWRRALADWADATTYDHAAKAMEVFQDHDMALFARGMRCLRDDERLLAAFRAANEVFHRIDSAKAPEKRFGTWRLFQVVYQVCQLPALRAREADPEAEPDLRAHLDVCDVLWFPTGGGKTEAYLGLITMALFYDRLRGKKLGTTAMLRFPLRMLSVQQLQRILDVLWWAERYRRELEAAGATVTGGDYSGDEFLLGYWVGRGNTPNSLVDTRDDHPKDNLRYWADLINTNRDEADDERIVTVCPNPACASSRDSVHLHADLDHVRLLHVCESCGETLPIVITDDEVYRYLPGVVVATVDKLAHLARAAEMVGMFAGPAYRCPQHNYFNNHTTVWGRSKTKEAEDRCLAGRWCKVDASDYELVGEVHDPAPALAVQDELHLLEEELGALDSHYETLMEVLAVDLGDGLPTKQLAASATIEAVDEQVRQLYARKCRVFPSPGWKLGESFYVHTTSAARRIYYGALPARIDPAEFGERIQRFLHAEVIAMQDDLTRALERLRAADPPLDPSRDETWLAEQLLHYELTLGYVNRKQDAERIATQLARRTFGKDEEHVLVDWLVADHTSLAHIGQVLNTIETQYANEPDRAARLRALVATSIVSHGVDLNALNLMVMNGMTPSVAGYVQSSSRSGRTHVGMVIVGFDRRKARERSFYGNFLHYHAFLDRLITPVPVNRFAKFAARWTIPGMMSALLLIAYERERALARGLDPAKPRTDLNYAKEFEGWLGNASAPPGANKKDHFRDRVLRALGLGKQVTVLVDDGGFERQPVFDPVWEDSLRDTVIGEFDKQMSRLQRATVAGKNSTNANFAPAPLSSFRSVDTPMDFSVVGGSALIELALTDNRSMGSNANRKDA
jgi:hypothetical protein